MKRIILFSLLCVSLTLLGCGDDNKPNKLPGGSAKRDGGSEHSTLQKLPVPTENKLPGGSAKRP